MTKALMTDINVRSIDIPKNLTLDYNYNINYYYLLHTVHKGILLRTKTLCLVESICHYIKVPGGEFLVHCQCHTRDSPISR